MAFLRDFDNIAENRVKYTAEVTEAVRGELHGEYDGMVHSDLDSFVASVNEGVNIDISPDLQLVFVEAVIHQLLNTGEIQVSKVDLYRFKGE